MAVAPTQNHRTYWAVEAIGTAKEGVGTGGVTAFQFLPGVQSVGISTNFNLEQIFQLGQLEIYQDLEDIPDIEVSVEKVIEGNKALGYVAFIDPVAHIDAAADAAIATTISGDQNNKVDVGFVVNQDTHEAVGDGDSLVSAWMSGMYLSSATFNFATDGYFTESLNLVGNHQIWTVPAGGELTGAPNSDFGGAAEALDVGTVLRRETIYFEDLPAPLGTKKLDNATAGLSAVAGDIGDLGIASLNISVDFGREPMYRLGQKLPYHRYVTFPVEVTTDIEAYVTDPDDMVIDAYPEKNNVQKAAGDDGSNTHQLKFHIQDGAVTDVKAAGGGAVTTRHTFDLGKNNYLQSVTWNGLSTDGTNATITYSYRNFNRLDVTSKKDSA
tara:strand:- start:3471 stop:4619 length:1149 start_codon:yes stop_codon:yes gene_type:complete